MTISDKGIELIKASEGLRLNAYPDPGTGGKPWTIGYGTTVYPTGEPVQPGDTITQEEAEEYLISDIREFEQYVNGYVEVPLHQNEFDALVSFVYNIGTEAFRTSTMLKLLNVGNYEGAAGQFGRWVHANGRKLPGLINRREAERKLFMS